jgi:hypothetical protein
MKPTGLAKKTSKSSGSSTDRRRAAVPRLTSPDLKFVVCIKSGANVDLEPLKVYRVVRDRQAQQDGLLRVVDASGEDYLYPTDYFRPIAVTRDLFRLDDEPE